MRRRRRRVCGPGLLLLSRSRRRPGAIRVHFPGFGSVHRRRCPCRCQCRRPLPDLTLVELVSLLRRRHHHPEDFLLLRRFLFPFPLRWYNRRRCRERRHAEEGVVFLHLLHIIPTNTCATLSTPHAPFFFFLLLLLLLKHHHLPRQHRQRRHQHIQLPREQRTQRR